MDPVREKTQLLEEIENAGGKGPSPDSIRRYLRLVRFLLQIFVCKGPVWSKLFGAGLLE